MVNLVTQVQLITNFERTVLIELHVELFSVDDKC